MDISTTPVNFEPTLTDNEYGATLNENLSGLELHRPPTDLEANQLQ